MGTRGWFSTWAITGAAPASVRGMLGAVSLLHFVKEELFLWPENFGFVSSEERKIN